MRWDADYAADIFPKLLDGLWLTIQVSLLGMALALLLGLVIAVVRYAKIPLLSQVLTGYVLFVRGTPLLIQAFTIYYVLPEYGITLSLFTSGVLILGVNYSAYTAEVYRAGIEAVPRGQWEASTALNLPAWRTWTRIVLPQGIATIIPVLGNYQIQMFKDSAILYGIGMTELLGTARELGVAGRSLEPLTIAGILYLVISYPAAILTRRLERRYAPTH
ncbi:MAG TPA: ectoine/hydroxyectoine ABC transporter permease subunit EhuD [Nocardioidaceae bacterium]|nr:ectoine/hydroxyectoine ABC transporter permease subunit EhuD [Nocardioidaceae bacterium]